MTESQKAARRVLRVMCVMIDWPVRKTDLAVVDMLTKDETDPDEAEKTATEYVWDHLMGESDTIDQVTVLKTYIRIKQAFYADTK